jgi:hypothetical protein
VTGCALVLLLAAGMAALLFIRGPRRLSRIEIR